MVEAIIFIVTSILLLVYSLPSLRQPGSHGYYRFFAWETILALLLFNVRGWFAHPFVWIQIISWFLLTTSLFLLVDGLYLLRTVGKPNGQLEQTTRLVQRGIYRLIRHPLYSSLLFLAWGVYFKSPSLLDSYLAAVATAFLYASARADENECLKKFGREYQEYMQTTKMFIPFVL